MNAINHSDLSSQEQIKAQHSIIFALVEHFGGMIKLNAYEMVSDPGPVMMVESPDGKSLIVYSRPQNANAEKVPK